MKFALLGYGKMGRQIEALLRRDGHEIVAIIDNEAEWSARWPAFLTADVAIDFSMPSVAVRNMSRCFENHVPVVVGTTGWQEHLPEVEALCREHGGSLVYGSNFSVGANIFMQLNRQLAAWMDKEPQYEAGIEETHHVTKKDAPSGTAVTLAKGLLSEVSRYQRWQLADGTPVPEDAIPVMAHREGSVTGIHQVRWHSEEDDIVIIHQAHSRQGFALGAVKAAVWLKGHPGVYDFADIAMNL
ncbi:MAG: 4-hydroxy-tetrahydrodipicolinate reductase [Bacteroidales bacterium]|nr:4-hydroxy-tetrahydrodipicolinate reductase [Bacteroidales bacterium]MBR6160846.1 4-hydroxy-tetrahydrodipicolinate reductase [Bacteroidales bacterium]